MRPIKMMRPLLLFFMMGIFLFGCTSKNNEDITVYLEKGEIAFARRDYLTASNNFKKACLINPKDISLINKIGECYLKLGRLGRAKLFYKKGIEIDPYNIDIQIKLAQIHILTWELSEAEIICDLFEKKNISHPELDLIRADLSLMKNQLDDSEFFYRKAVKGSKDALRPKMKLAIFLKSINKNKEAVEIFNSVRKHEIVSSQIFLLMADYYLLDDAYDQAEQSILDAIRQEPEDNSLKYYLVQFYLANKNNHKAETILENMLKNQNDIFLRMVLADVYLFNNKHKKAEIIILKLKEEIKEPIIEFELLQGKFWLYSGKFAYATSHLKSALDLNPGLGNALYLLGVTHLISGKIKLSENSLIRSLQIHPNHYKALLLISELLYKKKEYNLSLGYLDRLLENYPEDFTGRIIKGLNLLDQQKYVLAKKEFNASVHLSGKTYIPYYYLGLTEELMGNNIAALTYYEKVLGIYPDLIDVAYRYSMLLLNTKQEKAADEFVTKKLAERKNSPEIYYLAAKVAIKRGNMSRGGSLLKKAVQLEYVPGFIYMELAKFYKNNNQIKDSIETLKQCTQKMPYFQNAWLGLVDHYIAGQELTTALEIMEKGYKNFQEIPIFQSNLAWLLLENNQEINRALILHNLHTKRCRIVLLLPIHWGGHIIIGEYTHKPSGYCRSVKKRTEQWLHSISSWDDIYQQGQIDKQLNI